MQVTIFSMTIIILWSAWVGRLCHFLDYTIRHNLLVMIIICS
jgi:hypothetical protein